MFHAHDPGLCVFIAERGPEAEPPLAATLSVLALAVGLLALLMTGVLA